MWPCCFQSGSKCGDLLGMAMYSVIAGTISLSHTPPTCSVRDLLSSAAPPVLVLGAMAERVAAPPRAVGAKGLPFARPRAARAPRRSGHGRLGLAEAAPDGEDRDQDGQRDQERQEQRQARE